MVSFKLPTSGKALADIGVLSTVNKSRKPKFELHLKIYDLNNVPLVSGVSLIKWHLPHSIHGEHRGRTPKCPIANHKVEYNYSKIVPVRIAIDRSNNLSECPVEFEVLQEFESGGAGRDEKIVLGKVTVNLSEYVEESEAMLRDSRPGNADSRVGGHGRKRSSISGISTTTATKDAEYSDFVEEGVIRRYLMQESKINSTLKIGILMVQIDGEKNFVAPPLKTAPVFGGIAGIMAGDQVDSADDNAPGQALPTLSKSRDASELQDMYRGALAAYWASAPGELPADECIEDIFSGGTGFRAESRLPSHSHSRSRSARFSHEDINESGSFGEEDGVVDIGATLRPQDIRHFQRHHARQHSGASTVTREGSRSKRGRGGSSKDEDRERDNGEREMGRERAGTGTRSRSESLASLATTLGSDRGREGFKRAREVDEFEVRDDLVAWRLPGTVS